MSIASISSGFVTAVRERAAPDSPTLAGPVAEVQGAHKGGRRHELVDAMQQVLGVDGVDGVDSKAEQQAVFRFAHALMHDLRKIDASVDSPTPAAGRAWGRRSYNDLPQRLEALATASAAPAPASPATPPAAELPALPVPPTTAPPTATSAASASVPAADLPLQPDPLTATSAALHLMQVPTSRLLEAYAALRQALSDGDAAPSAPSTTPTPTPDASRAALAEFLTRLSTTLTADAPASLPTGSLLNVRA